MKNDALIGYTGFVGQTLLRQRKFGSKFRSTNIEDIVGKEFDLVVCAGAPAVKWLANKEPKADGDNLNKLINAIAKIKCNRFILISTVDVFKTPIDVNESSLIERNDLNTYGKNRLALEDYVRENFENHIIVRLPGLVGPGLKKNIIYDLLNDNNIEAIDSRAVFQFYPMVNLWHDIMVSINHRLKVVHLTSEPISVSEISSQAFGKDFSNHISDEPAVYDFKSKNVAIYNRGNSEYQYTKEEVLLSIRSYVQSEMHRGND
ncbi:NAD(P)-dependent oxidoreductase [Enterovibrio norvegicus]|uniref:NAD(P)-dependent oxidoreductase n=1 Tax=Enterovibrio norvegicus TaxID=188144 RepID=UPI0002D26197|nr:NAD(P)-dependent oxidoreductase [Enterovibrio norvegicus]